MPIDYLAQKTNQLTRARFEPGNSGPSVKRYDVTLIRLEKAMKRGKEKMGAYAMKRVAAGAHLRTLWLLEPAKLPDDRADYCLDCSFLP